MFVATIVLSTVLKDDRSSVDVDVCCMDCGLNGMTWECRECGSIRCCSSVCQSHGRTCTDSECIAEAWHALKEAVRRNDFDVVSRFSQWSNVVNAKQDVIEMDEHDGFIVSRRGWTVLHECVLRNDPDMIQAIVEYGHADIDVTCGTGSTPLAYCASMTQQRRRSSSDTALLASRLIALGANTNARDCGGRTPLHVAGFCGNQEVFQLLLKQGANVSEKDKDGDTPLHAIVKGWDDPGDGVLILAEGSVVGGSSRSSGIHCAIRQLLERGADINAKNVRYETPLHMACLDGKLFALDLLLQQGADPNARDKKGNTPLHTACHWNHVESARLLVTRQRHQSHAVTTTSSCDGGGGGVDASNHQGTTLHISCAKGNIELVSLLLENGASVDARDEEYNTPLLLACQNNHTETARRLLESGAYVNATNRSRKRSALHWACKKGSFDMVKLLLQHGADTTAIDMDGKTPLSKACARSNDRVDIVTEMVGRWGAAAAAAEVNAKDCNQRTPLHEACFEGNVWVAMFLIHQGADVNACDTEGDTPLMEVIVCATGMDYKDDLMAIARGLLEAGAQVHSVNQEGKNALNMATSSGDLRMVELLMAHGASEVDEQVEEALVDASEANYCDIVRLLVQAKRFE